MIMNNDDNDDNDDENDDEMWRKLILKYLWRIFATFCEIGSRVMVEGEKTTAGSVPR